MEVSFKLFLYFTISPKTMIQKGIIFLESFYPVNPSVKIFQRKLIECYKKIFLWCFEQRSCISLRNNFVILDYISFHRRRHELCNMKRSTSTSLTLS